MEWLGVNINILNEKKGSTCRLLQCDFQSNHGSEEEGSVGIDRLGLSKHHPEIQTCSSRNV